MSINFRQLTSIVMHRHRLELKTTWYQSGENSTETERFNSWPELAARYDALLAAYGGDDEKTEVESPSRAEAAELSADTVRERIVSAIVSGFQKGPDNGE